MEAVLDSLNSFNVSGHQNSIHAEHPRFSSFKSKTSKSSQEARRKAVLAARSIARYDLLMHMRNADDVVELATADSSTPATEEQMEDIEMCYKRPMRYKDFLMLSEWLVEVPEDFASSYLVVLVPVGRRVLVVSGNGMTTMYGRNGKCWEKFYSVLPGGSPLSASKGYAMFDCIVSYETNKFYVLDMIAWMNQSFVNCETQFRFEWMSSRLKETSDDPSVISKNNQYSFVGLPYGPCTAAKILEFLKHPSCDGLDVDGLLFYHKEGHYTHGPTPLVGWLRPYMVPEILGLTVPDHYLASRPEKYVSLQQHIEYGKQARIDRLARDAVTREQAKVLRNQKKKERKLTKKNAMDCTESPDSSSCNSPDRTPHSPPPSTKNADSPSLHMMEDEPPASDSIAR
ncbi:Snurportin-1 N-terminal [Trinorchestia longiramus]|nr:Snurportin-1 N-terminal [Trinorchestia longiramus]